MSEQILLIEGQWLLALWGTDRMRSGGFWVQALVRTKHGRNSGKRVRCPTSGALRKGTKPPNTLGPTMSSGVPCIHSYAAGIGSSILHMTLKGRKYFADSLLFSNSRCQPSRMMEQRIMCACWLVYTNCASTDLHNFHCGAQFVEMRRIQRSLRE